MTVRSATYRIQFGPAFGFVDAIPLVGYLKTLGVTHIYASPIFQATQGSSHGYDVTDPNRINPELGTEADFQKLAGECRKHGIGWLQDIVPNHMAYNSQNAMLMDVFEYGRKSRYYSFFDIFWNHPDPQLRGQILAPFLGKPLDEVLADGELSLELTEAGLQFRYYEICFPLALSSYGKVLNSAGRTAENGNGQSWTLWRRILDAFESAAIESDPCMACKLAETAKSELWNLYRQSTEVRDHIDANVRFFAAFDRSGDRPQPVERLLDEQIYKPAYWKQASESINYRRFFYLNDFIGVRVEDSDVFDHTHALLFRLVNEGVIDGVRIDHIDGLHDCGEYLAQLRERLGNTYIVLEKIIELTEPLPYNWPVEGTTGYDFCNYVNELFCMAESRAVFSRLYAAFTGNSASFDKLLYEKKRTVCDSHLRGDIRYVAHLFEEASRSCGRKSELPLDQIEEALIEIIARLEVYRTYISPDAYRDVDRRYLEQAIAKAVDTSPALKEPLQQIGDMLLNPGKLHANEDYLGPYAFIMKFQQFTGPAMAKGFEDTLLYSYNRLTSLNEVGSDPSRFGMTLDTFNDFNVERAQRWPHTMNALSTHDTKRSEDVRARINVLSEMPALWRDKIKHWSRLNRGLKCKCDSGVAPDANDEYLLYQTLIGTWPFGENEFEGFSERIKQYAIKAVREAKIHSTWVIPNKPYEQACLAFIDSLLDRGRTDGFLTDFLNFQRDVAAYGVFNSLSQTAIKMTAPGVPDFYQGTEMWDFSLVDPDNRRAVDFELRKTALNQIERACRSNRTACIDELLNSKEDGRIKLFLIWSVLRARREYLDVFLSHSYLPLQTKGRYADHVIAFARTAQSRCAVTIAPRFLSSLIAPDQLPLGELIWKDTSVVLPSGYQWDDVISDRPKHLADETAVGSVLDRFPVALLTGRK